MNDLHHDNIARVTRRQLFGSAAGGVGLAALASLLGTGLAARRAAKLDRTRGRWLPGLPHYRPKAKRVVVLWQGGGPSHVDLFDPKPLMRTMAGKDIPASVRGYDASVDDVQRLWKMAGCCRRSSRSRSTANPGSR